MPTSPTSRSTSSQSWPEAEGPARTTGSWFLWKSFIRTGDGEQGITIWQRRPRVFDNLEEDAPVGPYTPTSLHERLSLLWGLVVPPDEGEKERRLLGWALRRPVLAGLGLLMSRRYHCTKWLNHPACPAMLWRTRIRLFGRGRFDAEGSILQRPDAPPAWRHAVMGLTPDGVDSEQVEDWAHLLVSEAREHHGVTPGEWLQLAKKLPEMSPTAATHVMNGIAGAPYRLSSDVWDAVLTNLPARASVEPSAWVRLLLRPDVPPALSQTAHQHLCVIPEHHTQPPSSLDRQAQQQHARSLLKVVAEHPTSTWSHPGTAARLRPLFRHLRSLLHQDPEDLSQLQPIVHWIRHVCVESHAASETSPFCVLETIADDPELLLLLRDVTLPPPPAVRDAVAQRLKQLPPSAWRPAMLSKNPERRLMALTGLAAITDGSPPTEQPPEGLAPDAAMMEAPQTPIAAPPARVRHHAPAVAATPQTSPAARRQSVQ